MKKFLLRLTYFFITIFILACLFDIFISYRLTQSNERKYQQWSGLYQDSINADVIVLGNSRALTQYDPSILDSALNTNTYVLSLDGSAINRQIIKYENYRRLIKYKPKLILQNIDLMTLAITKGYEREQFFPYFIFDRDLVYSYQKYEEFNLLELYIPCYRYIGYPDEVKKAFNMHSEVPEPLHKGFYAVEKQYDGTILRNVKGVKVSLDSCMIEMFEEHCKNIKNDSLSLCFVYAPIYIGATNKMTNIYDMYKTYRNISDKYNIHILDYNFHSISLDSTNFYNATHLNKKGSILFSTQLAHDLDSLGILHK